ncbi:MAG: DUF1932 domain-containing protein [Hyphomicrobiales bacterium]|nr:DUF1932 domain-containing protein [Hyphomicrobiales bacterium]
MAGTDIRSIAFIGFGEVGQTFARGLTRREGLAVSAYDIAPAGARREAMDRVARELGVAWRSGAGDAARGADVVISAVTAAEAEAVAEAAAGYLAPGQIFLDVNSAAPTTKQRAARHVERAGASYVEGAVMGPVKGPGIAVPILAGGPAAAYAAMRLNRLGMQLTAVATEYGLASAIKLSRSIMIKGIEALMVDCAASCDRWGIADTVYASLAETFPGTDWHAVAASMRERVATHGVRRAAEMREAGEMLAALGIDPSLANAVADAQLRGVRRREK